MELTGKKIALLCEDLFDDQELIYPLYRMREAGAEVHIVAPVAGKAYKSKVGWEVKSDMSSDDITAEDYDAVIVPGGYSPDKMRRHESMVSFVRQMDRAGKPVAAICHAGWLLITAHIVRGRTVTGFSSLEVDLRNAGAEFVDREVVRDGNLITSRGPADLPAFSRTIIAALTENGTP
ncbi:MAG TPA: type 1 glutamine amidotransferase domain-containing protein [Chloroflexia bacterium]|jgi:protease I